VKKWEYQILTFKGSMSVEDLNAQGSEGWELVQYTVSQRTRVPYEGQMVVPIETVWKREKDRSEEEVGP
jgi:hypothetical protein